MSNWRSVNYPNRIHTSTTMVSQDRSQWTDLDEIMQDLSVAQGDVVPASVKTISETEPPSKVIIEEETEKEYYGSCGDVDFTKPPDFNLIKEMLSMVKDEKQTTDDKILKSKLDPTCPEFIPQTKNETAKRKAVKNVAMTSILGTQENTLPSIKLGLLSPSVNMFKRRITETTDDKSTTAPESFENSVASNKYTPSTLANDYYNKYLKNSKLKEQLKEDIWSKAEREMKTIDERNNRKYEDSSSSQHGLNGVNRYETGANYVRLLHHRHLAVDIENCVVCNVANKHGYSFEEMS